MLDGTRPTLILMPTNGRSAIRYPAGKNQNTVAVGDSITIGDGSDLQRFMVIAKTNQIITCLPYYNITIDSHPVQSNTAEITPLATSSYTPEGVGEIDMNDSAILVKQYINAYKTTLQSLGVTDINTRIPVESDLQGLTAQQKNPGLTGEYYVGNIVGIQQGMYILSMITNTGNSSTISLRDTLRETPNNCKGIRPIVEIIQSYNGS